MEHLVFENRGEIDIRTISVMGVNVKESESAIGYFGTGLKYAIACLLRWGCEVRVSSGLSEYTFSTFQEDIRGKQFQLISMWSKYDSMRLGYTTDLGKDWKRWMVYRELWSNAMDEPEGKAYLASTWPEGCPGVTRISIRGDEKMLRAHGQRDCFILSPDRIPLVKTPKLEIYEGQHASIFYRGIAVQKLGKPSLYTYNILEQLFLTEDRTASEWATDAVIMDVLMSLDDKDIITKTLSASPDTMESRLDYPSYYGSSPTWDQIAKALFQSAAVEHLHHSIRQRCKEKEETKFCPTCGQAMSH